jgi:hypothetical protein
VKGRIAKLDRTMSEYYDSPALHANPFVTEQDQPFYAPAPSSQEQEQDEPQLERDEGPDDNNNDHNEEEQDRSEEEEEEEEEEEGQGHGGQHEDQREGIVQQSHEEAPEDLPHAELPTGSGVEASSAASIVSDDASSSKKKNIKKYKLTIKVTGLERNGKKDPIIRFDAYTTLPRFRTTTFRDVRRTHHEFVKFFEHLNGANPECFVPSVPPSVTSAGTGTEEDEKKVKVNMQLWLDRVSSNPILARDDEFVYFIEAGFGYTPVVKRKPPATGLARKAMKQLQPPYDEVVELHEFRPLVKRVYQLAQENHHKLDKATKSRRSLGLTTNEFGNKAVAMANIEAHQGMMNLWRKLGKTLTTIGDLDAIKATYEAASFGDGIEWIANNAYVFKEALTNRHLLMRELVKAQASTKSKHQVAVRVKGSGNINPVRVDETIKALEDATHVEEQLTTKVRRVSENMLYEKNVVLANMEQDITGYIEEYALRMIECERKALKAWESIRVDVRAVDASGGLSRLGREATPSSRRATLAQSQGATGDSWSGDRHVRAIDYDRFRSSSISIKENDDDGDDIGQEEETVVDARNAASMLAGSTF